VFNKFVAVENTKTDRSGRLVGKVLLDGLDVNQIQVLDGLAWHFK
jgi:endonuclease YncB( thermonuclease family)